MNRPIRLLHFADAHIDIANYGRHDPETALPVRVMDFLRSLDQIVDTAINEKVDLVIFAGDAYKDRNPQPTFQREWGRRIMRLSQAHIPTILLIGNHDLAPAAGRAHTVQEFATLEVPYIHVADRFALLGPEQLGLPVQVVTVPWVARSTLVAREDTAGRPLDEINNRLEERLASVINQLIEAAEPGLPLILTAHASVQGAAYGSERAVMLGHELVLSGSVLGHRRLDYVAMGHIHKHQVLGADGRAPIVYPGSIERIDFGEAKERKGFVMATVQTGSTQWEFRELRTRRFLDFKMKTPSAETFMADVLAGLPSAEKVADAVCRVQLNYPRDWEPVVDEAAIAEHFRQAFSIQILKHRQMEKRARLGDTVTVETLSPEELLGRYWRAIGLDEAEAAAMQHLAKETFAGIESA